MFLLHVLSVLWKLLILYINSYIYYAFPKSFSILKCPSLFCLCHFAEFCPIYSSDAFFLLACTGILTILWGSTFPKPIQFCVWLSGAHLHLKHIPACQWTLSPGIHGLVMSLPLDSGLAWDLLLSGRMWHDFQSQVQISLQLSPGALRTLVQGKPARLTVLSCHVVRNSKLSLWRGS